VVREVRTGMGMAEVWACCWFCSILDSFRNEAMSDMVFIEAGKRGAEPTLKLNEFSERKDGREVKQPKRCRPVVAEGILRSCEGRRRGVKARSPSSRERGFRPDGGDHWNKAGRSSSGEIET